MHENIDREVDKIIESIKRENAGGTSHAGRDAQEAVQLSRSVAPKQENYDMGNRVSRTTKQKKKPFLWWIVAAAMVVLSLIVIPLFFKEGVIGGDVLKGTWSLDGTTVYQFEGNGKGAMILPNKAYSFSYIVNEEEMTVSIDFEHKKAKDATYSYQVGDDKLVLSGVGGGGIMFEFIKKDSE